MCLSQLISFVLAKSSCEASKASENYTIKTFLSYVDSIPYSFAYLSYTGAAMV